MRVYRESDLSADLLASATVAVIGYGNQGHAHALNLKDSNVEVIVGARRDGGAWRRAEEDGFDPVEIGEAAARADVTAMLLPDEVQGAVFEEEIGPRLKPGASLVFAHGFTIAFGSVRPPQGHDVVLVAPKGQGHYLRESYRKGRGLPCLVAVEVDASGSGRSKALSYAHGLGCLKAGAIETTFREEAVTDLFGEQVVLCGGVPAIVRAAYDTLVDNGYQPEIAYLECMHELKIITDLMHRDGIASMREKISRTAAWGSFQAESRVVTDEVKSNMKALLRSIESGEFADGWHAESKAGSKNLLNRISSEMKHAIEETGGSVRALMPHLKEDNS
jgi:ketol-acid reductoisomerase